MKQHIRVLTIVETAERSQGQRPDFRGKDLTSYSGIDLTRIPGTRAVKSRSISDGQARCRWIDHEFVELRPEEKGGVPTMMAVNVFRAEYEGVGGDRYRSRNRFYAFAPMNSFIDTDGLTEVNHPARHVIVQDREGRHEIYSPEKFKKEFF